MPTEWKRKSWAPGEGGWPTFGADGKVVREEEPEDDQEERE